MIFKFNFIINFCEIYFLNVKTYLIEQSDWCVLATGVESPQSVGEGDVLWRAPVWSVLCQCSWRSAARFPKPHLVCI